MKEMSKTPPVNVHKHQVKTTNLSITEKAKLKLAEAYYGHENVPDEEISFYEKLLAEME